MFNEQIKSFIDNHGLGTFRPKAVLFDMDGVLYDSMPNHAIAWQKSMAQFGISMTAEDAYATEGARGIDTIRKFAKMQLHKEISYEESQKMYDVKTEIFHGMPEAPIFDGVIRLMTLIRQSGLTIGIVTGSGQRPLIQRLLTDFGDFITAERIVTAYDVTHGKPAPDPYLMGAAKADAKPHECIVVENAPLGVKAGVAAGCFTIAVNSGPLPDSILSDCGAHIVLPSISRLADIWEEVSFS
ncbi:MAG: HAD family hydrolase [Prevotella sp.]